MSVRIRPMRPGPPESVPFPVTPMLDMAFQLLAFFILTFQAPSPETRIDLDLPATASALPGPGQRQGQARPQRGDEDLETDLLIRAVADDDGGLESLKLGEATLLGVDSLGDRLRRYATLLNGRPLRVLLLADDSLRYEEAAKIIGMCSAAGVSSVRLAEPDPGPEQAGP